MLLLTRAKEQLFIISSFKVNKDGQLVNQNALSSFFTGYLTKCNFFTTQQYLYVLETQQEFRLQSHFTKPKPITTVVDHLDFSVVKIAKEALMWGTHQQEAITYGTVLHEIMANIISKKTFQLL